MHYRSLKIASLTAVVLLSLLPVFYASSVLAQAQGSLELADEEFDWDDIVQDQATFRWSAKVANKASRSFEVQVILDLLDENDQVIHSDRVSIMLQGEQERNVQRTGSISYEVALEVVSYRFRLQPDPPPRD